MTDAVALAAARVRRARDRARRAVRCLALSEEIRLAGNFGADDLRDASLEELHAARRDFYLSRSHVLLGVAAYGRLSSRLTGRAIAAALRDHAHAMDMVLDEASW